MSPTTLYLKSPLQSAVVIVFDRSKDHFDNAQAKIPLSF